KHARASLEDLGKSTLDMISRFVQDPEIVQQVLLDFIMQHPDEIRTRVQEEIEKQHGPQPNDRVATETTAFILDNASALVSHQAPELVQFFGQSLNFAQSLIPSSVERAQLRILSESLIPQKQLEAYLSLQWSVIVRDKGTFILGDIGPIISCD